MVLGALALDGQLEWRGTLLGSGTYFRTEEILGWYDLPGQRGTNAPLPNRHGSYPGRKLSGDRYVEFKFKTKGVTLEGFPAAIDLLRQITAPDEDPQEEPLVIRLDGETWMCWGRVLHRSIPTNKHYALGYTEGSIQWEVTDPRLYSVDEQSLPILLAVPAGGGLDFDPGLDFDSGGLDFGAGTTGGKGVVTNTGHVPTWPRLEITGPCTGPVITFPGGRKLSFDPAFVVAAGQTLVIDTRPGVARTVLVNGVSMRSSLWIHQWSPLEPGVPTEIRFSAAAYSAAQLTVYWRHAKH